MKKALSYALGLFVGLLVVAPRIDYTIPVVINSYWWLYAVVVCVFLSFYSVHLRLPAGIKLLGVYLLVNCFFSQAPYVSFNAFILTTVALFCFLALLHSDFEVVTDFISAAFFVQVVFILFQQFGMDKLMNFDRPEAVFFGTVMQYMRLSSVFALMAPFLCMRNKWFIAPLVLLAVLSSSSSFALALTAGVFVYWVFKTRQWFVATILGTVFVALFIARDWESWYAELHWGRWTVWPEIVKSWVMNTLHAEPAHLTGPVDWKAIFLGRGLDTFLPLFPLFKHDPNPFPQAHNDFLQIFWELGVLGFGFFAAYFVNLIRRLRRCPMYLAGMACVGVNMFFTFPTRMTQTMFMLLAFVALCEQKARQIDEEGDYSYHLT